MMEIAENPKKSRHHKKINSKMATQQTPQNQPGASMAGGPIPALPIGSIIMYGGNPADDLLAQYGWVVCDGRSLDASDNTNNVFYKLFLAIGTSFGGNSDNNTFNLPDCRGLFVRGVDMGANRDPDVQGRTPLSPGGNDKDNVGSYQADQFRSHTHGLQKWYRSFKGDDADDKPFDDQGTVAGQTAAAGGSETRPVNLYLYYIIKYM